MSGGRGKQRKRARGGPASPSPATTPPGAPGDDLETSADVEVEDAPEESDEHPAEGDDEGETEDAASTEGDVEEIIVDEDGSVVPDGASDIPAGEVPLDVPPGARTKSTRVGTMVLGGEDAPPAGPGASTAPVEDDVEDEEEEVDSDRAPSASADPVDASMLVEPAAPEDSTLPVDLLPPEVGARLRCDTFEGSLTVVGEVKEIKLDKRQALLWLPALGHHWPVDFDRIHGGTWVHDPTRYPPPGKNERFDQLFRAKRKAVTADAPGPSASKPFTPPRPPRRGHVWVEIAEPVVALGFSLEGHALRDWQPGQKAEIGVRAVAGSTHCFRKL